MPLAKPLSYMEQMSNADIATGILKTPLKIDFHRSLLDTTACETFTELIVTDKSHPYVIGAHLTVKGASISAIDLLVADADDWLFNADNYLKYSTSENWAPVPRASRSTTCQLLAAANAYLDVFNDNSTPVPWGTPCNRLEGGAHTGNGSPTDSCNVGVPSGMHILNRRFIVDEEMNAVDVLDRFIKETGAPDSHLFRLENGKIRYVHTITICLEENCGFRVGPGEGKPPAGGESGAAGAGASARTRARHFLRFENHSRLQRHPRYLPWARTIASAHCAETARLCRRRADDFSSESRRHAARFDDAKMPCEAHEACRACLVSSRQRSWSTIQTTTTATSWWMAVSSA
jgi:hypothetical protein